MKCVKRSAQQTLANHRGIPNVAYNADPNTAIFVYIGFFPNPDDNGYYFIGGTSEGSPQWAGVVADANFLSGRSLGFLNPQLYALGRAAGSPSFSTTLHLASTLITDFTESQGIALLRDGISLPGGGPPISASSYWNWRSSSN